MKRFSPREADIAAWVEAGGTLDAYAEAKRVARTTVKTHVKRILRQTGGADLREALLLIQRERR